MRLRIDHAFTRITVVVAGIASLGHSLYLFQDEWLSTIAHLNRRLLHIDTPLVRLSDQRSAQLFRTVVWCLYRAESLGETLVLSLLLDGIVVVRLGGVIGEEHAAGSWLSFARGIVVASQYPTQSDSNILKWRGDLSNLDLFLITIYIMIILLV